MMDTLTKKAHMLEETTIQQTFVMEDNRKVIVQQIRNLKHLFIT
jgi:hypothetical protein